MCRTGGRRCPSSHGNRPSRSAEAVAIRGLTPGVAEILHNHKRAQFIAANGEDAVDLQTTTDPAYIIQNGGDLVDVSGSGFAELPADWQREDLLSARSVTNYVANNGMPRTQKERRAAAAHVHEDWLRRNRSAKGGPLDRPFDKLPKKERDRYMSQFDMVKSAEADKEARDAVNAVSLNAARDKGSKAVPKSSLNTVSTKAIRDMGILMDAEADKEDQESVNSWKNMLEKVDALNPKLTKKQRNELLEEMALGDLSKAPNSDIRELAEKFRGHKLAASNLRVAKMATDVELSDRQPRELDMKAFNIARGAAFTKGLIDSGEPDTKLKAPERNKLLGLVKEVNDQSRETRSEIRDAIKSQVGGTDTVKNVLNRGEDYYKPSKSNPNSDPDLYRLTRAYGVAMENEATARDLAKDVHALSKPKTKGPRRVTTPSGDVIAEHHTVDAKPAPKVSSVKGLDPDLAKQVEEGAVSLRRARATQKKRNAETPAVPGSRGGIDSDLSKKVAAGDLNYDQAREQQKRRESNDVSPAKTASPKKPYPVFEVDPNVDYGNVENFVKGARAALKKRSGKTWSVKRGTGTSSGWVSISVPPRQLVDGRMTQEDAIELNRLLGRDYNPNPGVSITSIQVPASVDYRTEFIDRAHGREPRVIAKPYWD